MAISKDLLRFKTNFNECVCYLEICLLFRSPPGGIIAASDIHSSPQQSIDTDHTSLHERSYIQCKSDTVQLKLNILYKSAIASEPLN